jgi:hypothetical protein
MFKYKLSYNKYLLGIIAILVITFSNSSPIFAAASRTTSQFSGTTSGTEIIPYLDISNNRKVLVIDMQRKSFDNVEYIHYNLNYNTTAPGDIRGAEGTIYPWLPNIKVQMLYWQGQPFFRQYIPLGTCSRGECTYDPNPSALKITVHTKYFGKAATDATVLTITR